MPYATGPVRLTCNAVFSLARSHWTQREPVARAWHTQRRDADNVIKAVKDAAKGILYLDDSQVCDERTIKHRGAQEEAPYITLAVTRLPKLEVDDE